MKIQKTQIKPKVAEGATYLEMCVVPKSTFMQRMTRLFIKSENPSMRYLYKETMEEKVAKIQHRLELVRTLATTCNTIISIFVLLRVFGVLK